MELLMHHRTTPGTPRVYRLTPARATALGLCPLHGLETTIRRRYASPPSAAMGRGIAAHGLLHRVTRALAATGATPDPDAVIRDAYPPSVSPDAGDPELVASSRTLIEGYLEVVNAHGLTIVDGERWIKTAPRQLVAAPDVAVEFSGIPDVVARRPDGGLISLDFKTGGRPLPDHADLAGRLGTPVTVWLLAYQYGCAPENIEVALCAPHRRDWVGVRLDAARLEAARSAVRNLVRAMDGEDFPPTPGHHCVVCPVRTCPAYAPRGDWADRPF